MTRQQVERAYPHFEEFYTTAGEKVFGLKSYIAAGCEFTVFLSFLDNRLQQVHLECRDGSSGARGAGLRGAVMADDDWEVVDQTAEEPPRATEWDVVDHRPAPQGYSEEDYNRGLDLMPCSLVDDV
jgi:hypothetical protein